MIITQIIPIDINGLIHKFTKESYNAFIIIFEPSSNRNHAYLDELDVESNTNGNLSIKYNHNTDSDIIWKSIEGASYCYGL